MREIQFLVSLFSILLVTECWADDCRVERIYDPDTHAYKACQVEAVTPSYKIRNVFPAQAISERGCNEFCDQYTLLPVASAFQGGRRAIVQVPRDYINELLALRSERNIPIPPELFLVAVLNRTLRSLNQDSQLAHEHFERYVQSQIRQRDPSKVLNAECCREVKLAQLSAEDQDTERGIRCTICQESVAGQIRQGFPVARINCGGPQGGHLFCRDCIQHQYQYSQDCPNCHQPIRPYQSSEKLD